MVLNANDDKIVGNRQITKKNFLFLKSSEQIVQHTFLGTLYLKKQKSYGIWKKDRLAVPVLSKDFKTFRKLRQNLKKI